MSKILKWKTDKIYIYPLGGVFKLNDDINKPLFEELLIVIMGPLIQIIYFKILTLCEIKNISFFNYFLLIINLLPVYPLDGGKILNIIMSFYIPYRKSLNITLFISFITYIIVILFLCLYVNSIIILVAYILISIKIYDEYKKKKYYFNKFLLERHLKNYRFPKIKYIKNIKDMYRERLHYFYIDNKVLSEKKYLDIYFKYQ